MALTASGLVTSVWTNRASPSAATTWSTVSLAPASSTSATSTLAPASANATAVARPSPDAAPVTSATRSFILPALGPSGRAARTPLRWSDGCERVRGPLRSCEELAAVHVEGLAGDHPRHPVGREEHDRLGDVLLGWDLAERDARGDLRDHVLRRAAALGDLPVDVGLDVRTPDPARHHRVDPDLVGREVDRHRLRRREQRALRRRVATVVRPDQPRAHRRDVHDRAGTARLHRGDACLRELERTPEVDLVDLLPEREVGLVERLRLVTAERAVHQDVDAAELARDRLGHPGAVVGTRDAARHDQGLPPGGLDLRRDFLQPAL